VKADLGASRELDIQHKQRSDTVAQMRRRARVKRNNVNREIAVHSKLK
jgi:hypothetical protein